MILLTTSRRPIGRIRTFCRDLANSILNIISINRGKMSLDGIAEKAIELEADRVIVIDRWHGGAGKIKLFQISSIGLKPIPPLLLIRDILLRREFNGGTRRTRSSAITLEPEDSPELNKVAQQLSKYFDLPRLSLVEAFKNHSISLHFSFDSSQHLRITFMRLHCMIETGPRITLSKLIWEVPS